MQSVFGIAKNVNGRRAASAYHLLPGASSSNGAVAAPGEPQPLVPGASPFDGVTLPLLKTSPASSLASSLSSSSLVSLGGLESAASSSSRLGTPTSHGNADLVRLNSSPFISIKTAELEQQDGPVNKHGSVVDKTNPFIGYFQTGRDSPPPSVAKTGLPPRSTSGAPAAPVTTPYAALLSQPKRIADWIGSQSTRLPSLFSKREASENASHAPRAPQPSQEEPSGAADGLKSGSSLLSSLKAAANSLGALSRQNSETQSSNGTTESPAPITALSLKAATSRFAQDFDVLESLGQGGQGAVFKARSKVDGCVYAIKQVALSNAALDDAAELEQARREAVSMAAIPPHNNVVRYHTAWIEVEPVERVSSSTASVRGSDVPSDDESLGLTQSMSARVDDAEDDTSFSLGTLDSTSAYATFENSFGGFEFEDPSQSTMSFTTGKHAGRSRTAAAAVASDAKLAGVGKSKLTLYIQMELCSTTVPSIARADETFDRFVDRLQQRPTSPRQEQYSNLTQWLRSSVDERSGPRARRAAKHTEGLKLFLGVAQGVSHMHSVGVIHRDLKPDNIFIHGDVAKVGDFGLSKSIFADTKSVDTHDRAGSGDESGDHTTALGTFTYASPEQLGHRFNKSSKDTSRVKSAKYSVKSDIFALGVMLLELCCPFGTMMERSQVLTAVRHGVVPQTALKRYPSEMALVLRMTAVDPAERPSAEEICEQIRSLLTARNAISARSALDEFRDLQAKLALAVHQLRDRSQSTLQLESLVAEMNDKLQVFGSALA